MQRVYKIIVEYVQRNGIQLDAQLGEKLTDIAFSVQRGAFDEEYGGNWYLFYEGYHDYIIPILEYAKTDATMPPELKFLVFLSDAHTAELIPYLSGRSSFDP